MKYLFSVIIPALNEKELLPLLLKDLSKQRDKKFEVIVVDGKSEDGTKEIARSFSKLLPLTVLDAEERNVSSQRNQGAKQAEGKYLIFLDADCRISSLFISKLRKEIESSYYLLYLLSFEPVSDVYTDKIIFKLVNYGIEASQNLTKPLSSAGNCVIEKHFFEHLGGYNEKLFMAEDHAIVQYARNAGVKARFVKNIKVRFSLRRIEKDGWFTMAYRYAISLLHTVFKGDIKEELFEYEMGGARYKEENNISTERDMFKNVLKQLKKSFQELNI